MGRAEFQLKATVPYEHDAIRNALVSSSKAMDMLCLVARLCRMRSPLRIITLCRWLTCTQQRRKSLIPDSVLCVSAYIKELFVSPLWTHCLFVRFKTHTHSATCMFCITGDITMLQQHQMICAAGTWSKEAIVEVSLDFIIQWIRSQAAGLPSTDKIQLFKKKYYWIFKHMRH